MKQLVLALRGLRCTMVPVFNGWVSQLADGVLLLLGLCWCCHLGMLQTSRRWMAWALRQLGVVEAPGTDAGIEMAGDGAGTETVGIETSRFETTLALRAGDYLGVVIALRQLGMTVDVETDVTCIGIEQLVLRAAIRTEGDGGQHHKHSGEVGRAGHYCCHR